MSGERLTVEQAWTQLGEKLREFVTSVLVSLKVISRG